VLRGGSVYGLECVVVCGPVCLQVVVQMCLRVCVQRFADTGTVVYMLSCMGKMIVVSDLGRGIGR